MTAMIDAVLSYHINPQTCGVAKFNYRLALQLGVPHDSIDNIHTYKSPLVSAKFSEVGGACIRPGAGIALNQVFDLFVHDRWLYSGWLEYARRVYAANESLATALRTRRPDVRAAFCPSTVDGNPTRGAYNVLAFGMAHKLALPKFEELKQQLEIEHPDYTVSLSTAVHEGSPWDTALTESVNAMRDIFSDKLRVLGYLGDDALAKELQDCDAVAVYFDPAVRENNTTVWAALSAGKTVYTNTDEHSPVLDPAKYSWEALERLFA